MFTTPPSNQRPRTGFGAPKRWEPYQDVGGIPSPSQDSSPIIGGPSARTMGAGDDWEMRTIGAVPPPNYQSPPGEAIIVAPPSGTGMTDPPPRAPGQPMMPMMGGRGVGMGGGMMAGPSGPGAPIVAGMPGFADPNNQDEDELMRQIVQGLLKRNTGGTPGVSAGLIDR